MKFVLALMLMAATSSQASAYEISCQSKDLMVKLTFAGPQYNAVVLQKDSFGEWTVIYAEPVTKSTTRGNDLLFQGESFGLGIMGERSGSSRLHRGTLRLWLDDATFDEKMRCRL